MIICTHIHFEIYSTINFLLYFALALGIFYLLLLPYFLYSHKSFRKFSDQILHKTNFTNKEPFLHISQNGGSSGGREFEGLHSCCVFYIRKPQNWKPNMVRCGTQTILLS
ncbi:hypothetical protein PHYBLDRAFT_67495 [Phycomyces blakesleeanus NRRL 1555(-)]|uniref:Uncharacterized protein n=1 Tax=Phycomyces blakesleeanus (strain ATCC 8743b / DSM 1359 / FGSC 10004 / NBRC 33097 / NRRL 1555) TaxID=763407 RepID=A0A162NIN1_PHYB8|nr:hypothetical protein PHYBLDRAFT_67495 [Phycomyces blakesleeanus NRRL 1555(-)]OAD74588.1 hypothetical protein PHYBLDRAFT_67495 [Phycomyces blakesleeanus NRRL 1555(-)]|eukprot:XP_018292628.1 hypothetical protein PHYBLDRAFT_67495 [Phycomyces blakesleeanus NRRL 1555(-)]